MVFIKHLQAVAGLHYLGAANHQNSGKVYKKLQKYTTSYRFPCFAFAAAFKAVRLPATKIKRIPTPVSPTRDCQPAYEGGYKQGLWGNTEGQVLSAWIWILNASLLLAEMQNNEYGEGYPNSPQKDSYGVKHAD